MCLRVHSAALTWQCPSTTSKQSSCTPWSTTPTTWERTATGLVTGPRYGPGWASAPLHTPQRWPRPAGVTRPRPLGTKPKQSSRSEDERTAGKLRTGLWWRDVAEGASLRLEMIVWAGDMHQSAKCVSSLMFYDRLVSQPWWHLKNWNMNLIQDWVAIFNRHIHFGLAELCTI